MRDFTPAPATFHPIVSLLFLAGFFFLGNFVGMILGFIFSLPFIGGDLKTMVHIVTLIGQSKFTFPHSWNVFMILQGFTSIGGFIGGSVACWFLCERKSIPLFAPRQKIQLLPLVLLVLLGLTFIVFNEWIYQWNRNWDLPDSLSGFENWSKKMQKSMEEMTRFLTRFDSFGKMLIGLLVIAVIPAIGEELLFRGMLQSILIRWFKNTHAAIWLTGFIFSFIHFQLDGFIPRMLLGVVFGYLYVWSGNIWYPIWAHFINNGVTVIGVYLYQRQQTTVDLENTTWITPVQGMAALLVCSVLLWYLNRIFRQYPAEHLEATMHVPTHRPE